MKRILNSVVTTWVWAVLMITMIAWLAVIELRAQQQPAPPPTREPQTRESIVAEVLTAQAQQFEGAAKYWQGIVKLKDLEIADLKAQLKTATAQAESLSKENAELDAKLRKSK